MKGTLLALCFSLFAFTTYAHPPKSVSAEFINSKHLLKVTVVHGSKDRTKHYIDDVVVKLNGKDSIIQKPTTQSEGETHLYKYILPDVNVGDKLEIEADCSIFGDKKIEITVTENKKNTESKNTDKKK